MLAVQDKVTYCKKYFGIPTGTFSRFSNEVHRDRFVQVVELQKKDKFRGIVLDHLDATLRSSEQLYIVSLKTCVHSLLQDLKENTNKNSIKLVHGIFLGFTLEDGLALYLVSYKSMKELFRQELIVNFEPVKK